MIQGGAYSMRNTWLAFSLVCASATIGCGPDGHPGGKDMSVPDAGVDMAIPDDLTIPDDAQSLVTYTAFSSHFAQELCAHYMKCGQVDAAQLDACIERETRHLGWDADVEIMKGRAALNELQCLDAVKNARCDNSDSGAWQSRCVQFL